MVDRRTFNKTVSTLALTMPFASIAASEPAQREEIFHLTEHGHLYVHGRLVASTHGIAGDRLFDGHREREATRVRT